MSSSGIGYIISLLFLAIAAFWTSPDRPLRFLDPHGGFMVFAGTAAIALVAVPWEYVKRFFSMIKVVSKKSNDISVEILE